MKLEKTGITSTFYQISDKNRSRNVQVIVLMLPDFNAQTNSEPHQDYVISSKNTKFNQTRQFSQSTFSRTH